MAASPFKSIHYDSPLPENLTGAIAITCPPETDVWNKPPTTHSFNAPIIYRRLPSLTAFKSARVTVSAKWTDKYDQGGLCLIINPSSPGHKQTWVKTGIEFLNGQPHVSTVATNTWSDWSLRPTASPGESSTTIHMESNEDGSLWVYLVMPDSSLSPIREVTWWADLNKDSECWIGVYAAKPAKAHEDLIVNFSELHVDAELRS